MRRLIPSFVTGLRARLVLAFVVVVAIALALIVATLPRLLDGYFAQQSTDDLFRRAGQVRSFVATELFRYEASGEGAPRPILVPTEPLSASDGVRQLLGSPDAGYVRDLATGFAQANIRIRIAVDREHADEIAYELFVPFPDEFAQEGQQRESITSDPRAEIEIPDQFWTQSSAGAPQRGPERRAVRSVYVPSANTPDDRRAS